MHEAAKEAILKLNQDAIVDTFLSVIHVDDTMPDVNDDATCGFSVNDWWFCNGNGKFYQTTDTTAAAAIWVEATPTAVVQLTPVGGLDLDDVVVKPTSFTANHLASYSPTAGKLTDSGKVVGDFATSAHAHAPTVQTVEADAGTFSIDFSDGAKVALTLGNEANTIANPTNVEDGGSYAIILTQPASGAAGTVTWGGNFKWPGGTPPTLSTANGAVDVVTVLADGTSLLSVIQKAFA